MEHRGQHENTLPKGNWKKMFENQKYYLFPVGNFREFLGTFRGRSKERKLYNFSFLNRVHFLILIALLLF